jgi:hypothetical protein
MPAHCNDILSVTLAYQKRHFQAMCPHDLRTHPVKLSITHKFQPQMRPELDVN